MLLDRCFSTMLSTFPKCLKQLDLTLFKKKRFYSGTLQKKFWEISVKKSSTGVISSEINLLHKHILFNLFFFHESRWYEKLAMNSKIDCEFSNLCSGGKCLFLHTTLCSAFYIVTLFNLVTLHTHTVRTPSFHDIVLVLLLALFQLYHTEVLPCQSAYTYAADTEFP